MLDITDKESLKTLSDTLLKAREFTGSDDDGQKRISPGPGEDIVVKSVNLQISLEKITGALEILADKTGERNFTDAMEVIWFSFDPKRDKDTFDRMSMLTTLMRATLDGNVRPPVDLDELYQDCYQKLDRGQEQKIRMDLTPSPHGKRF